MPSRIDGFRLQSTVMGQLSKLSDNHTMILAEKAMFVEGEKRLGQYMVYVLQQNSVGGWLPHVMGIDAIVTNYRLMLRPMKRKYAPATLPGHMIQRVELTTKGNHHCVMLRLGTGFELYLLVGTGNLTDFFDDLSVIKMPRPKFQFDDSVAKQDIERLVSFFRG